MLGICEGCNTLGRGFHQHAAQRIRMSGEAPAVESLEDLVEVREDRIGGLADGLMLPKLLRVP